MTRKGIESDSSRKAKVRQGAGIALVFLGMISLGTARVLIGLHLGDGIKIFTFFGGALLLGLGFLIQGRKRRSR
jgi:LPXTG-motif cell wall-anchored protein